MPLSEDYLKSVSESQLKDRAYIPYELAKYERDSLEEISKLLKQNKYKNKDMVNETLEFLESLANKINIAVINEKKEGKTTWELENELSNIKKMFEQLELILSEIEKKEVDNMINRRKRF